MSDAANFVEAWNSTIPFKIKPNDLSKPTGTFLLNALVSYLYKLNIDVSSKINVDASDIRRIEKIKLCHYINDLYMLFDSKISFCYFDLLHPAPKKTAHVLKVLLNYYLYYNMVKTEVLEGALSVVDNYETLLVKRNRQELENEENKIKLQNVEVRLKEQMRHMPELQETYRQYEIKKEAIDSDLIDLETTLKNSGYTISQYKTQIEKAKSEMVMDSEMKYILEQIAALDNQIKEYSAMEASERENNQTIVQAIPEFEAFNRKLEDIIDILTVMSAQCSQSKEVYDQLINQLKEEKKIASGLNKQKIEIENFSQNTENDYKKNIEEKEIELKNLLDSIRDKQSKIQYITNDENKIKAESVVLEINVKNLQSQIERMTRMAENVFTTLLNENIN